MLNDSVIVKNNRSIEAVTNRLNNMGSYQQNTSRTSKRKMLEAQLKALADENIKLNPKWTNKSPYTIKDK